MGPQARAQVAASATIATDYIYRGVSLSDGQPALTLALVYDDKSGVYGGGSLIGEVTRRQGAEPLGHQEDVGYAFRMSPDSTLDFGVNNLVYRGYYYGRSAGSQTATELYAGIVRGQLNYYLHFSPNYFRPGARALYGEINGAIHLPRPFRLVGHVGVLTPLGGGYDDRERYDLRLGIAATFRHAEAQLAWTTARPGPAYADPSSDGHSVVALSLTWFF